jgi:L-threonylcarbamoyladenylate synthase
MTEILPADESGVARASLLLRAGRLVAFGTETVYGLGGDATNERAVAAIFAAKDRPRFNPLICHYPHAGAAFAHVVPTPLARRLAEAFWPGPLTLVLARAENCPVALLASAGLDTLAVRVPAHSLAQALLRQAAIPIAAPSANRSGRLSPTTAEHVMAELGGRIAAVVESGASPVGVESTVLDLSGNRPVLLRPGGISCEAIEELVGPIPRHDAAQSDSFRSPGLLASHYAPELALRLDVASVAADEALLAFGPPLPGAGLTFQLSTCRDLAEAATRLFAGLRWLDAEARRIGLARIAVMPVPQAGLGLAIVDRLRRAAAPRGP